MKNEIRIQMWLEKGMYHFFYLSSHEKEMKDEQNLCMSMCKKNVIMVSWTI